MFSLSFALVGIELMHHSGNFPLFPSLPSGVLGDVFGNGPWVLAGSVLALLGALLAYALLPAMLLPAAGDFSEATPYLSLSRPAIGSLLFAALLYLYIVVQAASHTPGAVLPILFIFDLVVGALALARLVPSGRSPRGLGLTAVDGALILFVVVAFIWLNGHDLRNWLYAFIGDEWSFFDLGKTINAGYPADYFSQMGVYGYHPVANSGYQALIMRLAGVDVTGWRLSSILSVALSVPALYWGAKQMSGVPVAVVASVLYASCHLLWAYARIGYNNNDPLLVIVLAAALLYVGLRDDRPAFLIASGMCAGAAWYVFFTGRLMIGVLGLAVLTEWRGGPGAVGRRLACLVLPFALVVLPLALNNGESLISQMVSQTNLSHSTTAEIHTLLEQNTVRGIYAFFYAKQDDHYVLGEIFDAVSGAGLCLGLALAVRRWRYLQARLLLIWFVLLLALTAPTFYSPQIPDTRLQVVVPAAAILAALGICSACQAFAGLTGAARQRWIAGICAGALAVAAFSLNAHRFYVEMPVRQQPTLIAMTLGALQHIAPSTVVLAGDLSNDNLCQVLDGYGIDRLRAVRFGGGQLGEQCPDPAQPQRTATLLPAVTVLVSDDMRPTVQHCFPLSAAVVAPNGQQHVWSYEFGQQVAPQVTYLARLQERLFRQCPALAAPPR